MLTLKATRYLLTSSNGKTHRANLDNLKFRVESASLSAMGPSEIIVGLHLEQPALGTSKFETEAFTAI